LDLIIGGVMAFMLEAEAWSGVGRDAITGNNGSMAEGLFWLEGDRQ
jgi:hypothetical protein